MKIKDLSIVIRDMLIWAMAIGGVAHQEITGQVKPELLTVYTALLGVPGALGLLSLRGRTGDLRTSEESQSPAPSSSSSAA